MSPSCAAVVVTYNRKDLLLRCLQAISAQSRPPDQIYIWDNASTDDTRQALVEAGWLDHPRCILIHSARNLGGAGGFHHALKRAYDDGHEWIWLMDDDTIPRPTCWEQLLAGAQRVAHLGEPLVLASKVLWRDGSLHPMNVVGTKFGYDRQRFYDTAAAGCISIRAASFVSCAIHRKAVAECGLPIADYFIWSDDIEYTGRILRQAYGVCVPDSIADHLTANTYGTLDAAPARFYYHIRNHAWLLRYSSAYSRSEKAKIAPLYAVNLLRWLARQHLRPSAWGALIRGLGKALWSRPKS